MKVMEAGAVFLIIAGVLVGPIERRTMQDWGWEERWECYRSGDESEGVLARKRRCDEKSLEPIAETCERAMREIGAFPSPPGVPPGFRLEDEKDEKAVRPGDKWRLIGGEKVLCISAPSGLSL